MVTFGPRFGALTEFAYERLNLEPAPTPFELFKALSSNSDYAYLLESGAGPKRLARYSFLGFSPSLTLEYRGEELFIRSGEGKDRIKRVQDPLPQLRELMAVNRKLRAPFPLLGGAVGYISYDCISRWERVPEFPIREHGFPLLEFAIYDDGIIYDHTEGGIYYYYRGRSRMEELMRLIKERLPSSERNGLRLLTRARSNKEMEDFRSMVLRAKDYISEGEIFQVVLARRIDLGYRGSLLPFYEKLKAINPSPYMYYLKMGNRSVIGSSPEMLMRVEGSTVETYPIAGTRPYTQDKAANEELRKELLRDEKERAEHVMLVDLARNDVGRVAKYGSVKVPQFMRVRRFSHVQHIVSRVVGRLKDDKDAFDAFRSLFPAGTVSGAPKVRAMEIITELEVEARGPYAGAVGYFSYSGDADFAITIRTLVANGERCSIQVGAGIVVDSKPDREWLETEQKALALLQALDEAQEMN